MDKSVGIVKSPGYVTYKGNGFGRDSYIIVGNAGLLRPDSHEKKAPRTGYQINQNGNMYFGQIKKFSGPQKEATVFKYFGDGTGRDYYVTKDSGGMIP